MQFLLSTNVVRSEKPKVIALSRLFSKVALYRFGQLGYIAKNNFLLKAGPWIGSKPIAKRVSRMTFFIQSCPRCARRFDVHIRSLGKPVTCKFCEHIFRSFDGNEDSGEASDQVSQWAREQDHKLIRQENHEPAIGYRPR
jgi:hypothetical protein